MTLTHKGLKALVELNRDLYDEELSDDAFKIKVREIILLLTHQVFRPSEIAKAINELDKERESNGMD